MLWVLCKSRHAAKVKVWLSHMQVRAKSSLPTTTINVSRVRKVKCDEGKPSCKRCRDSGRACDGYGIWGGGAHTDSIQRQDCIRKPIQLVPLKEQFGFEWYLHRSVKKLPGPFSSEHWTTLIIQGSVTEPVIRYAVLAVSSAHKAEVKGMDHDEQETTVRQYSKAIRGLQQNLLSSGTSSIRLTLIVCLLFIQTDFLRGYYQSGLVHLECGLKILQNLSFTQPLLEDGWLITHFRRLLVQGKLFHQLQAFSCRGMIDKWPSEQIDTFRSSHHARRNLEQIMLHCFSFDKETLYSDVHEVESQNLRRRLYEWNAILERSFRNAQSSRDCIAYILLRLYYRITFILVHTRLNKSELAYDEHQSTFLGIIHDSIEIYKFSKNRNIYHDPEPTSPNSLSDMGWIAPLYFTAIKCRNRRIRIQAVKLLELSPHRESIWSSSMAFILGKKIIHVEEAGFYDQELYSFDILASPTKEDLETTDLPERARLSGLEVILPNDGSERMILVYERAKNQSPLTTEYNPDIKAWTNTTLGLKPKRFVRSTPHSCSKAYQQLLCQLPNQELERSGSR